MWWTTTCTTIKKYLFIQQSRRKKDHAVEVQTICERKMDKMFKICFGYQSVVLKQDQDAHEEEVDERMRKKKFKRRFSSKN